MSCLKDDAVATRCHKHQESCYRQTKCGKVAHTHTAECGGVNTQGSEIEKAKLLVGANIIGATVSDNWKDLNPDILKLWGLTQNQVDSIRNEPDSNKLNKLKECLGWDAFDLQDVIDNADENFLLGIASRFCVFVKDDYEPLDSDAEGRVAIGGNLINSAGFDYQIGRGPYMTDISLEQKMNNIGFAYLILGGSVTLGTLGDERNDGNNPYQLGNEIGAVETAARRFVLNHENTSDISTQGLIQDLSRVYVAKLFDFETEYQKYVDRSAQIAGNYTVGASKRVSVESRTITNLQKITEVPAEGEETGKKFFIENETYTDPEYKILTLTYNGNENQNGDTIFFNLSESDIDDVDEIHFVNTGDANIVINVPDDESVELGTNGTTIVTKFTNNGVTQEISKQQKLLDISNEEFNAKTRAEQEALMSEISTAEHTSNNHEKSEKILYNFYNAGTVVLNRNLNGTILAPHAHINGGDTPHGTGGGDYWDGNGHLSGALIAKSFKGALEIGFRPYVGGADIAVTDNVTVKKNWANVEPREVEFTLYQSKSSTLTLEEVAKLSPYVIPEGAQGENPVTLQADSQESGWQATWPHLPQTDQNDNNAPYYYYVLETSDVPQGEEVHYSHNGIQNGLINVTNHKDISLTVEKDFLDIEGNPIDFGEQGPPSIQFELYASTKPHTHVQKRQADLICKDITHNHTAECYAAHLICTNESLAHKHEQSCYACYFSCSSTDAEHTHSDACIACSYLPPENEITKVGEDFYQIDYNPNAGNVNNTRSLDNVRSASDMDSDPELDSDETPIVRPDGGVVGETPPVGNPDDVPEPDDDETPIVRPDGSIVGGNTPDSPDTPDIPSRPGNSSMSLNIDNLPAVDENGNKLYYYVKELNPGGYEVTYDGNASNADGNIVITNRQKSIEITVEKNWVGANPNEMGGVEIQIEQYVQSNDSEAKTPADWEASLNRPLMFSIAADKTTLEAGETAQIQPINVASGKTVSYRSSDTEVATVNENGIVTAVKNGTATITASCDGQTAAIDMEVATKLSGNGTMYKNLMTAAEGQTPNGFRFELTQSTWDVLTAMWANLGEDHFKAAPNPLFFMINGSSELKVGIEMRPIDGELRWVYRIWSNGLGGVSHDEFNYVVIEDGALVFTQTEIGTAEIKSIDFYTSVADLAVSKAEFTYPETRSLLRQVMMRANLYRSLAREAEDETMKLRLENGSYKTLELNSSNGWTATLEVPVCDYYGNPYYYSAKETPVPDNFYAKYQFKDGDDEVQSFISGLNPGEAEITITNARDASFSVNKTWSDTGHENDEVVIALYKADKANATDDELDYVKELTLSAENGWKGTFHELDTTEGIFYYVRETQISIDGNEPKDYTTTYSQDAQNGLLLENIPMTGITVTNTRTYKEHKLELTVKKEWLGRAPNVDVKFIIKQFACPVGESTFTEVETYASEYTLNEGNKWTCTIDGLPGQDTKGTRYKYEVVEVKIDGEKIAGYKTEYTIGVVQYVQNGDWTQEITITNKKIFNLSVMKWWSDHATAQHYDHTVFFKLFRSTTKPNREGINLYEALTVSNETLNAIRGETPKIFTNKLVVIKDDYNKELIRVTQSETPNTDGKYEITVEALVAGDTKLTLTDGVQDVVVKINVENPQLVITLHDGEGTSIQTNDTLQLIVTPTSAGVTFSSDKENIATVDEHGVVTGGTTAGTATITASAEGYESAEIVISVGLRTMTLSVSDSSIQTFETTQLSLKEGENDLSLTNVTFETSDADIATVDASGKLTAGTKGGKVIITANKPGYAPTTVEVEVTLRAMDVTPKSIELNVGETKDLSSLLTATSGGSTLDGVSYAASASSEGVVSISGSTIEGKAKGDATITASKPGYAPATVNVTVNEPEFTVIRTDTNPPVTLKNGDSITVTQGQEITFVSSRPLSEAKSNGDGFMVPNDIDDKVTFDEVTFDVIKDGTDKLTFTDVNGNKLELTVTSNTTDLVVYDSNGKVVPDENQGSVEMAIDETATFTSNLRLKGAGNAWNAANVQIVIDSNNPTKFTVKPTGYGDQMQSEVLKFYVEAITGVTEVIAIRIVENPSGGGNQGGEQPQITIEPWELKLIVGNSADLKAIANGAELSGVTYTAENGNIVRIDGSKVTALAEGTTTITASKDGYKSATVSVTVETPLEIYYNNNKVVYNNDNDRTVSGFKIPIGSTVTFTSSKPIGSLGDWNERLQSYTLSEDKKTATLVFKDGINVNEWTKLWFSEGSNGGNEFWFSVQFSEKDSGGGNQGGNDNPPPSGGGGPYGGTNERPSGNFLSYTVNDQIYYFAEDDSNNPIVIAPGTTITLTASFTLEAAWSGSNELATASGVWNGNSITIVAGSTEGNVDIFVKDISNYVEHKFYLSIVSATRSLSLRSMTSMIRSIRSASEPETGLLFTSAGEGIEATAMLTLSATSEWKYDFTDLEAVDSDGNPYYYWVVEYADENGTSQSIPGYETSYIFQDGDAATDSVINGLDSGNNPTAIICNVAVEQEGVEMPSTGGRGTSANTFAGMAIMAVGAAGYFGLKRRRLRRSA